MLSCLKKNGRNRQTYILFPVSRVLKGQIWMLPNCNDTHQRHKGDKRDKLGVGTLYNLYIRSVLYYVFLIFTNKIRMHCDIYINIECVTLSRSFPDSLEVSFVKEIQSGWTLGLNGMRFMVIFFLYHYFLITIICECPFLCKVGLCKLKKDYFQVLNDINEILIDNIL